MVNYCCVYGCGRNSRSHGHLTFYTLPKDKARQTIWLKAACPEVLGSKLDDKSLKSRRICSRHFAPAHIKNQRLVPDAVPTLCLNEEDVADVDLPEQHPGLACNECSGAIIGYRYTCTECPDYDLCQRCEAHGTHAVHCMLRLPKPAEYETVKTLLKQFSMTGKPDNQARIEPPETKPDHIKWDSSDDDAPITSYMSHKNSQEVDLPEYVQRKIREEVLKAIRASRVIQENASSETKLAKTPRRAASRRKPSRKKNNRLNDNADEEIVLGQHLAIEYAPEEISSDEQKCSDVEITGTARAFRQSAMDIEMNETLSEFLIKKV